MTSNSQNQAYANQWKKCLSKENIGIQVENKIKSKNKGGSVENLSRINAKS